MNIIHVLNRFSLFYRPTIEYRVVHCMRVDLLANTKLRKFQLFFIKKNENPK